MTLRKAGCSLTCPVSVSPWISTWTRAADSRSRNCLPLRAAIWGTVPSAYGRPSRMGPAVHLLAGAEELADRHRVGDRLVRGRMGGPGLGAAGRAVRGGAADAVHLLRRAPRPVERPERGGPATAARRAGLHHRVGRDRAGGAGGGRRAAAADRLPGVHAGQRGGAGLGDRGVEDLDPLRGGVRFGGDPGAVL